MRTLVLTRKGLLGTVAVFVVAAVCVRLGIWQLHRRAERAERNAVIAARLSADPIRLDRPPADTAGLTYRRVSVAGSPDEDRTIVLAGRSHAGRPGVHVYTPLRLDGGAILVNRGWLPAPDAATVDLAPIRLHGEAGYEGVLLPFPHVDRRREPGDFRRTWFRLDGDGIRAQHPYPVAPLYLQATDGPTPVPGGRQPVRLGLPALDAGPHLSYAIQWFSFAAIFLVGWAVLLSKGDAASARERGDPGVEQRPGGDDTRR